MLTYYLAIDIGASSGRHILGHIEDGKIILEEIYRFENLQIRRGGHDCWNTNDLYLNILEGMKACKEAGKVPATMGIDTWAVDFILLDKDDQKLGDAVAYRDSRTEGIDQMVYGKVSEQELYSRTGIQKQIFNTVYQLAALQREHPEQIEQAESFLMIPDYFHFLLTGVKKQEYTNATTTNLVNAQNRTWDKELLASLDLPEHLFGPLSMPGSVVGRLSSAVQEIVGFDCTVVLPATHDTGSAFLAVPARDGNAVYLSSGTWSLLGVENKQPITTEESRRANFTNEGGYACRFRYLKNIMGLWMIQSIRRELNGVDYVEGKGAGHERLAPSRQTGFGDLIQMARESSGFPSIVDVDDPCFLSPDGMIRKIKDYCRRTGQQVPDSIGEVMQCVYRSLAKCYTESIRQLERLTGKTYTSIHIVGGGCQDMYLNQMTAQATGLPVYAGPVEGTALGNLIVQMIYKGEFADLRHAREAIKNSFDIKEVL